MNQLVTIGNAPWSMEEIRASLDEFQHLYEQRPVRDNSGGMQSPHMFAVWFMARHLAPQTIVESGIWKGQSTWLLEQACPDANIISIDLNLTRRQYISSRVQYSSADFSAQDFTGIDPAQTLVFFDDHQNAYNRLQQCHWFGIRHVIFEDNYPSTAGDCYSLKKAFSHSGFQGELRRPNSMERAFQKLGRLVTRKRMMQQYTRTEIAPNHQDAAFLYKRLQTYYEFPPIFQPDFTRWGDAWTHENYPTPQPILERGTEDTYPVFAAEAAFYTWICYAQLQI